MVLIYKARKFPERVQKTYLEYEKLLSEDERELLKQIKEGKFRKRRY